ncbi:MAG TPA: hypothetical protein VN636_14245, partial [Acidimicrobiia bacterium]|nr:hypothetical protein [Acidimicrobiia bacterium]
RPAAVGAATLPRRSTTSAPSSRQGHTPTRPPRPEQIGRAMNVIRAEHRSLPQRQGHWFRDEVPECWVSAKQNFAKPREKRHLPANAGPLLGVASGAKSDAALGLHLLMVRTT